MGRGRTAKSTLCFRNFHGRRSQVTLEIQKWIVSFFLSLHSTRDRLFPYFHFLFAPLKLSSKKNRSSVGKILDGIPPPTHIAPPKLRHRFFITIRVTVGVNDAAIPTTVCPGSIMHHVCCGMSFSTFSRQSFSPLSPYIRYSTRVNEKISLIHSSSCRSVTG
jgi:hypothetical protein